MTDTAASLAILGPLALLAAASLTLTGRLAVVLAGARAASLLALAVGLACAGGVAAQGPVTARLAGALLSLRLDAVSAAMLPLVGFVGAVVVQYSRNYLDGDPRQASFVARLCQTLAAVMLLVLAGSLPHLLIAWVATSLTLHRLLLFYPERKRAVIAARKKFVTARLGDLCLGGAALLLFQAYGTADIAAIGEQARGAASAPAGTGAAALLIAVAALLKCAQFPAHGWLPEVMETPTPVSALLHAGIINAGGFLVLRFADCVQAVPQAMHLLAVVGGFSALLGSVVMLTQSSIKAALAWSTMAQMGFMLLQCGLGAFSLALLHILAHSLYKAHAFLSAGSAVDIARGAWVPEPEAEPHPLRLIAGLGLGAAVYAGIAMAFGVSWREEPAILALGAIVALGLGHLGSQGLAGAHPGGGALARLIARLALVAAAYFALHGLARWLFEPALPAPGPVGAGSLAIMVLAVASFALVSVLQGLAPALMRKPGWRRAYVHLRNAAYANALEDRMAGAMRRP